MSLLSFDLINEEVGPKLSGRDSLTVLKRVFGRLCSPLSFLGGAASKDSSSPCGSQRQCANEGADNRNPPSYVGRELSGVSSLPLGAKIGAAVVMAGLA